LYIRIRREPIQCGTAEIKLALKFEHQQIMVDGVEGSGEVKQAERGNVPVVGSEQKVVIDRPTSGTNLALTHCVLSTTEATVINSAS